MKPADLSSILFRKDRLIIFLVWLIIHCLFLWKQGIVTTGESEKYIIQARLMLDAGHVSSPNYWLYFTQIFVIMIAILFKLGWVFVISIQFIVHLWAIFSFYKLAGNIFSQTPALLVTLLFLLNYPMHEFNVYLQTESLFYSLSIIFTTWLLQIKKLSLRNIPVLLFMLALLSITRPTGILFVPAGFLYLFFHFFRNISTGRKILIVSVISVAFLFVLNMAIGIGGDLDFMLPYYDERIICGVPTLYHFVDIKTAPDGNSIYGLLYYISHNFGQFIRLVLLRSKAFFGLMRTYFSTGHNIFLAVYFYPVYAMVLAGLKWWIRQNPHYLLYFSTIILITWGTVSLTCDDWHNRFFLTISPWLLLLTLPALNKLFAKFTIHDRKPPVQ